MDKRHTHTASDQGTSAKNKSMFDELAMKMPRETEEGGARQLVKYR